MDGLKKLYDKPLNHFTLPFSNENLKTVDSISNFHCNLFQNIIFYTHNNFEINVLVDAFEIEESNRFSAELAVLDVENSERLFLQLMTLYQAAAALGLDFIDFSTFRLLADNRIQFSITLTGKEKKTPPLKTLLETFQKNNHFKNLKEKNLRETFNRLKNKYTFAEDQLYLYKYDNFAASILNTYPIGEIENNANIKIKINTGSHVQKRIIKTNLYSNHGAKDIFFANLANPADNLPDAIASLLPVQGKEVQGKGGPRGEDFISIINRLNLFLKKSSFTSMVLMIDRLRTREDAEFINYLLEAPGITNTVFICFDTGCNFIEFDLELNEKPGNLLKNYLLFTGTDETGPHSLMEIQLLKIFHTLPVPVSLEQLSTFFTPPQCAGIDHLIKKNLLKVSSGKVFFAGSLSRFNIKITRLEEKKILETFLDSGGAESLHVKIKYFLLTRQFQQLKETLKHYLHEGRGSEEDLPGIKQILTENYFSPGKNLDIELLEILVSLLVEENKFNSAKELIFDYGGMKRSIILKLKLAHIYKWEKEYSRMDELLTEIKNEKLGKLAKEYKDEFYYLRFVYHEKVSGAETADRYRKKIKGKLYQQRASVLVSDRYLYKKDYRQVEILLNRAIAYFHQERYQADEIEAQSLLAKLLREKNAGAEAEKSYQNLFIKSEMQDYRLLSAYIAVDLGNLYWMTDKFKPAEAWYKKALKIFQQQKNQNGIVLGNSNLVEVNKIKGRWVESKNQLESILDYDLQKNALTSLPIDYFNIAHLEYLKHRFARARQFIDLALPMFYKHNNWIYILESEVLKLKISFLENAPHKMDKIDLSFFQQNPQRLDPDWKILAAVIEIAKNDPLNKKEKTIIKKLNQVKSKTHRYDFAAIIITKYKTPGLLELLKSLSSTLSKEDKNLYYYEYFYVYYSYFMNEEELQEEKERFNEVYYFFRGNQRKLRPVIVKYKQLLEDKDSQYDIFKSAKLVNDSIHWKIPEDFFNSLVKEIRDILPADLVRLVIYENKQNSQKPLFDFSSSLSDSGGNLFQGLTFEIITYAVSALENPNLGLDQIKQQFTSGEKALYFYKNTKVISWKVSETLFGAILLAFTREDYKDYDFGQRHSELLKKFASLIHRFYENDFKLNKKLNFIIGESPAINVLKEKILKVSKVDFALLIKGESGSGKELVAKAVHLLSSRSGNPFITVNAAAIPENLLEAELFGFKKGAFTGANESKTGLIEAAHNGSLFLDEIADLPLNLQAKLLRVLQENEIRRLGETKIRKVNVRLICATNRDLQQMILENQFRDDLYYRLEVLTVQVPPLRERREDIPLLVRHFLKKNRFKISDKEELQRIIDYFKNHPWTGNVRELESSVKRLITYYPDFQLERDITPGEDFGPGLLAFRERQERAMILKALKRYDGNRSTAATALKITRQYLLRLMKKYKI